MLTRPGPWGPSGGRGRGHGHPFLVTQVELEQEAGDGEALTGPLTLLPSSAPRGSRGPLAACLPALCSDAGGGSGSPWQPRRLSRPPEALHHSPSCLCSALAAHPRARPPILLLPSPCRESSGTLAPDPASSFGTDMCPSPLLGRNLLSPQRAHHTHPPSIPSSLSGES